MMAISAESELWLDVDLDEGLDSYLWLEQPVGIPVRYVQTVGFTIIEESELPLDQYKCEERTD